MKILTPIEQSQLMHDLYVAYGTQQAVANALHVDQQRIHYWMNIAKKPPYEKIVEMQMLWEKIQAEKKLKDSEEDSIGVFLNDGLENIQTNLQYASEEDTGSAKQFVDIEMIFRDARLAAVESRLKMPLRTIFVLLLLHCCDRHGEFKLDAQFLKREILPYVDINFDVALSTLCELGLIETFPFGKETYGIVAVENYVKTLTSQEILTLHPQRLALLYDVWPTQQDAVNKTIH